MKIPGKMKHLAIIMDGNARWTKSNFARLNSKNEHLTSAFEGHRKGAEVARSIINKALELEIPHLTLFAFSSENWQRSEAEIASLMELLDHTITAQGDNLHSRGIKLQVIGRLKDIPENILKNIERIVELTALNEKMCLSIAFSYGGRNEIVDACQKIIDQKISQVNPEIFQQNLYAPLMSDVDLLIRTGGDLRISNFLLWQIAYAELYFTPKLWPDFLAEDLELALEDYATRKRNFGHGRY